MTLNGKYCADQYRQYRDSALFFSPKMFVIQLKVKVLQNIWALNWPKRRDFAWA
jgi:hypothetical protein